MEWLEQALLALAIGLPVIVAWMVVATAQRAVGLQLRASKLVIVAREAMPVRDRELLQPVAPLLEHLGFAYRVSTASERSVVTDAQALLYTDVYEHADGHTQAWVSPSVAPEQGEPCSVSFLTLMGDGSVQCTVNCYRHNLVAPPTYWTVHDDYLPELAQAWERHLARIRPLQMRVVRDPLQVFRASQRATEMLLADFEKRGIVVRVGEHWRMRWGHALRFAWGLMRGMRKVARARKGQPTQAARHAAATGSGAEAEMQAFEQQLAVLRAQRNGRRDKFWMFLASAALFLAVGSFWISWSFLPILLAVIALHEGGHWLAMRLSGYRNVSVFFVPGLGGLATGEKEDAGPWEKLLVYLAGPMPGLLLAVAGLAAQYAGAFQPPGWFQEFLIACLIINYLNLLPITPLDGGRVVETFLFARLPVARFLFALAGLAAFVALGLATGDKVLLVVAVLIALALPHQWRVMRLDRVIVRSGQEVLDERGAIERIFGALQQQRFLKWPFATRAAAATALLPELQGRRPGAAEAAGGLLVYLACLLAPPVLAVLAMPQLRGVASEMSRALQMVADDVEPEPKAARGAPRDWVAEADKAASLPEPQRLQAWLAAADHAIDHDEPEKARPWLQSAWGLVAQRPPTDLERARVLLARARLPDADGAARALYRQVVSDLGTPADKPSLLLLAEAKEQLTWLEDGGGAQRTALLREVVEHREQAAAPGDHPLLSARLALARHLDEQGAAQDAEALLRRNVEGVPVPAADDRRREALMQRIQKLEQQVELAWFLVAHERGAEAESLLAQGLAAVPARVSVSWEHAHRLAREARLWALLQQPQAQRERVEQAWRDYDDSRASVVRPGAVHLMHEVDRYAVAQVTRNAATLEMARSGIFQGAASPVAKAQRRLVCEANAGRPWRGVQAQARQRAAEASGLCSVPKAESLHGYPSATRTQAAPGPAAGAAQGSHADAGADAAVKGVVR